MEPPLHLTAMPEDSSFRRNLLIVAVLHVFFIGAVWLASEWPGKKAPDQVLWLEGGSVGGGETGAGEPEPVSNPDVPEPEPEPPLKPEMQLVPLPVAPPAPSEIVQPKATPAPITPRPTTPRPTTPKPTTPKPETPKPSTPKATPKATPPASPKPKATPKVGASADTSPKPKASPAEKPKGTPGAKKTEGAATSTEAKPGAGKTGGNGPGTGNGKGPGKAGNGTGASENGWYFSMLHDRLHNRWEQPTSIVKAGADFVTTLKIRIAKDGTISNREIVNSSGNPVMDESVLAAANKVQQIDPLPAGLGDGEFFEIKVNFKLDQGQ